MESVIEQRNKIHPHKFTLWVAIGSIVMMFAGLTSAYIVKSGQAGWHEVKTPGIFWVSTATMLLSSLTVQAALRSFKQRSMTTFRILMLVTLVLGIAFVVMQWMGFNWLWERGVHFEGASGAGQFLYIIFGLHALHVLGGIVALIVLTIRQYTGRVKTYTSTPIEIMSTYWHFVDLLWIYLLVFFIWIG
ncbi:MAG TPA: heme-copper oxidase subunit III [Flavisolibacter sp.]|nr:heme-copper oxidase subunit III [Flavisolibacter sp.]